MKENKKKLKILKNIVLFMFLFIGILLVFKDPIENWLVSIGIDSLGIDDLSASDLEENNNRDTSFDFEEASELDLQTVLEANFNRDEITVIGAISIPSVKMNLPIGKGTSRYTLALTAGTMKEDQVMGEGNYALAGHHMTRKDLLFSPLYEVEMGAAVYLTDLKYVYEYQIDEQRTIEATEVGVINDIEGETILTLITCDKDGEARLLTRGHFVKKIPVEEASKTIVDAFNLKLTNTSK